MAFPKCEWGNRVSGLHGGRAEGILGWRGSAIRAREVEGPFICMRAPAMWLTGCLVGVKTINLAYR